MKYRLQDSFFIVSPSMIAGSDSNAAGTGTSGAEKLLLSSMYRKLIVNVVLVWFLILELFI
jgi:hypothetical protein